MRTGFTAPFGGARRIVAKPPVEALTYTDDTQMMIAVAEALLREGRIDEASLMAAFVENFDAGRGYGQGTRRLVETARDGGDWVTLSHTLLPGGSLGNGGAMRVARSGCSSTATSTASGPRPAPPPSPPTATRSASRARN